ncbi:MAG: hypothetical protein QJQ54_01735 [Mollicutes bacterium]|nr:MAG: hypothetical protein QJQ54_01735 [Mollicutes bacterium]
MIQDLELEDDSLSVEVAVLDDVFDLSAADDSLSVEVAVLDDVFDLSAAIVFFK